MGTVCGSDYDRMGEAYAAHAETKSSADDDPPGRAPPGGAGAVPGGGRPDSFATELIVDRFPLGDETAEVRFYRRPLSAVFAAIREAGFDIDELAEPAPLPECAERFPDAYASLTTAPRFLYLRLRPRT